MPILDYLHTRASLCQLRLPLYHRHRAVEPDHPHVVSDVAAQAIQRAGVEAPSFGAHVLRHSAATGLLRQGASLQVIGEVLRHRSVETTAHYAKVDVDCYSRSSCRGREHAHVNRRGRDLSGQSAVPRGFKLQDDAWYLASFARFASAQGETHVVAQTAITWAGQARSEPQRATRLKAVIRFARFSRATDRRHEMPPTGVFNPQRPRPVPYLFSVRRYRRSWRRLPNSVRPALYDRMCTAP